MSDDLLSRNEEYAANWVPWWEDALCSSGQHQGGVGTHGNYREWLLNSFKQNKPFDTMVLELLDPEMPGHPDPRDRQMETAGDEHKNQAETDRVSRSTVEHAIQITVVRVVIVLFISGKAQLREKELINGFEDFF